MKDGKKVGAGTILAALVTLFFVAKARAEPGPEGEGAGVKIEILDAEGNPVPSNSPATLNEGGSYTVQATVKNLTTRGGVAFDAMLETLIMASAGQEEWPVELIPYDTRIELFAPNETKVYQSPLIIPDGLGGITGIVIVNIFDPSDNLLATKSEPLIIKSMAIIYAASVTIGV